MRPDRRRCGCRYVAASRRFDLGGGTVASSAPERQKGTSMSTQPNDEAPTAYPASWRPREAPVPDQGTGVVD